MQRLTRHVSVIRTTNRRRYVLCVRFRCMMQMYATVIFGGNYYVNGLIGINVLRTRRGAGPDLAGEGQRLHCGSLDGSNR